MSWWENLFPALAGTVIGGGIVIVGDVLRDKRERKGRRGDAVLDLYADLFVSLHAALRYNETFYRGVKGKILQNDDYKESPKHASYREEAERKFREALWRALLLEKNAEVQLVLKELLGAFDEDFDDRDEFQIFAVEYDTQANSLRNKSQLLVKAIQRAHSTLFDME